MNTHLSKEQLIRHIMEDSSPAEMEHLTDCAACRTQSLQLQQSLSAFGTAVRTWSGQESEARIRRGVPAQAMTKLPFGRRWRWSLAIVTVALIAAIVPIYKDSIERQRAAQAAEDALLLEQVNAHLSRVVPVSVEPLIKLFPEGESTGKGEVR